jgi:hypothetical protein
MVQAQQSRQPFDKKPLSNAEVKQLLLKHMKNKVESQHGVSYLGGNEQGNVLRNQTLDYLDMCNHNEDHILTSKIRR